MLILEAGEEGLKKIHINFASPHLKFTREQKIRNICNFPIKDFSCYSSKRRKSVKEVICDKERYLGC